METFMAQDFKMIEDLKQFANAINFKIKNKNDLLVLLNKWANNRVELTNQILDYCFEDYLTKKGY